MRDMLRTWEADGFKLETWDTHRTDWRGQTRIGYTLTDNGAEVFSGTDFSGSPMHADDADETVAALLSFLSLKPGDTDREYFDDYTPEQMAWVESGRAEELGYLAMEMEEGARANRE